MPELIKGDMRKIDGVLHEYDGELGWDEVGVTNVVKLNPAQDPDVVLEKAKGVYQNLLIVGYDHEGEFDCRADLGSGKNETLFMAQQFCHNLLSGDYTE